MFFVLVCGGDDYLTSYDWCVLTVCGWCAGWRGCELVAVVVINNTVVWFVFMFASV